MLPAVGLEERSKRTSVAIRFAHDLEEPMLAMSMRFGWDIAECRGASMRAARSSRPESAAGQVDQELWLDTKMQFVLCLFRAKPRHSPVRRPASRRLGQLHP